MPDFFPFTPDVIGDFHPDEAYDDAAIPADDFDEDGWPLDFSAGLCEFEAALGWDDGPLYPDGFRRIGVCRCCGCTPYRACRDGDQGCHWIEETRCSRCTRFPGRRRWRRRRRLPQITMARHGRPPAVRAWATLTRSWLVVGL